MSPGKNGGSGKKSKARAASSSPENGKKNTKKEKKESLEEGSDGGGMEISNPDELKEDKSSDGDKMRIKYHQESIEAALSVRFGGEDPIFAHDDEKNSQVPDLGPALVPVNVPIRNDVPASVSLQAECVGD